jgi:PAS domain S-box-containing protein
MGGRLKAETAFLKKVNVMAKKPDGSTKTTALRRQAEARLRATKRDVAAMPIKDVQQLVYELQVYQIELEMQNEELRRTQVELETARDRYVNLYDCAPTGYLTLDLKGVVLEANLQACTLLGMNRKDLLGQPVIRLMAAKDQAAVLRHFREVVSTGTRQAYEVDLARQDGVPVSVRFESVAVQGHLGQHTQVLTALMDITGRILTETAMWRYQDAREQLSHNLHDGILQSLYAIGLNLDAAKMEPSQVSDETSAILAQNIDELNSVMREVRIFIEELGSPSHPKAALPELTLSDSLHVMAETLAQLHGRQVRVSVAHAVETGLSHAEGLEIVRLAKEALSNSFRHAKSSLVSVLLNRVKGTLRLTVRDNGVGFYSKEKTGQGHGLINMAARAKLLGGTLSVLSRPAKGTWVVFDLPKRNSMEDVKP